MPSMKRSRESLETLEVQIIEIEEPAPKRQKINDVVPKNNIMKKSLKFLMLKNFLALEKKISKSAAKSLKESVALNEELLAELSSKIKTAPEKPSEIKEEVIKTTPKIKEEIIEATPEINEEVIKSSPKIKEEVIKTISEIKEETPEKLSEIKEEFLENSPEIKEESPKIKEEVIKTTPEIKEESSKIKEEVIKTTPEIVCSFEIEEEEKMEDGPCPFPQIQEEQMDDSPQEVYPLQFEEISDDLLQKLYNSFGSINLKDNKWMYRRTQNRYERLKALITCL